MAQQFFYDEGIRKWILQVIRIFSEYTVQYGLDNLGNQLYTTVPVIWGDATFSAATVARLNSENTMPSFPLMSIYISNFKYNWDRCQDPTYVNTRSVRTRLPDPNNPGQYLPQQANAYTVQRLMPTPYDMTIKVDIVTSNTQQKLQILEQILPLFNPQMEIQKTDNFLDWESLSTIRLTDVTWSNRTIPVGQGADSSYDVCTLEFLIPIWLGLPAKVSKMGVIFKVITNLNATQDLNDLVYGTRQVITFNNYGIFVQNGQIYILNQGVDTINGNVNTSPYGQPLDWRGILNAYGNIRAGVSQIGLTYDNTANEIVGTVTIDPTDPTILLYAVDSSTLPANTLPIINGVVNPQQIAPGLGLPNVANGQSYLLTANIGTQWPYTSANSNATANVNDIITYSGSSNSWVTTFSATDNTGNINFVWNASASSQIQWNGNAWVAGYEGPYNASFWRLII